jgi:hypothetical protein
MLCFVFFVGFATFCDALIYGCVTSSLQNSPTPQAFAQIIPDTGRQTNIVQLPNSIGGLLLETFVALEKEGAIITVADEECVLFFSLLNGKNLTTICSEVLVLDNIAVFNDTVWVVGYNQTDSQNFLYSVNRATGGFQREMHLPGVIEVAESTFSDRLFFLVTQSEGGAGNNLTVVDVVSRRIISNVRVTSGLEILVYSKNEGLLAWVATEVFAGQLIVIDPNTGSTLRTIVSSVSLSANGGSAVYDSATRVLYSVLLQYQNGDAPVWTITNTVTGQMQRFFPPNANYPWAVGLAIQN